MSDLIIVAIISLAGTLGGSWLGVRQANKLTCYRIEQLEQKVQKHNCLIERMMAVEESTKSAHKRIDEIKEII
jgi:hypothetical protein